MGKIITCDSCGKRQSGSDEKEWFNIRLQTGSFSIKLEGTEKSFLDLELCSKCGKKVVKAVLKQIK
ncbi:MAG: hypothetical protein A2921_00910 [Candidatus Magasanikbacteria bacterium RIFCSPLOWO2_01_FULL_43_20b]|uniref:Uncharacterized protein n=1 Tax=Candidatus Magasanikbacteria bacterium RIFCSPLOWO2_12_FULL_43_12 TaxID=1798692 RepID=A0A1F6MQH7_9BACT|nr:MAG: hypothetical protein A3I93_02805 [Candidatus Magasanikbacteria bacterium RIFCSPLOWO2_02_FULL_43_22]OGH73104.1 MAG: hypothetical protein A2921_00910 [Candidatus Magasanikbacteria bacterium RIFCSPLOWO2_01_FULL_43_20b]OGH73925.1 MAG: hypothetical protein A3G00_03395 [Candidatus Magasanikbacteria bacterium RIFCSPLOWO2_12_FULL_43_12]OGT21051.1 MAG: hypothetical protein A3C55_01130 [Gammaproteobacteria bacterium RIFCSPHIGHO2_02_FULL_42_13]